MTQIYPYPYYVLWTRVLFQIYQIIVLKPFLKVQKKVIPKVCPSRGLIMTSTRTKFEHWLIGSATSVLKEAFINRDLNDDSTDLTSSLPFNGPLQLPTKMQALKLFWFFKDKGSRFTNGRSNGGRTNGEIQGIVARITTYYWRNLAAYETVSSAQRQGLHQSFDISALYFEL